MTRALSNIEEPEMSLLEELKEKKHKLGLEMDRLSNECESRLASIKEIQRARAELDTAIAALEPAPAEQAPAKNNDDWQDNRRRFTHPTSFEDGPLGVSFNADDVIPDWLLLPDYVWTTQADGSVLVTPQAPAQPDPPSAELRSDPGSEENAGTNSDVPEGFKKWEGGECPLPDDCRAAVRLRNGFSNYDISGKWLRDNMVWRHGIPFQSDVEVIAYRIISQPADQSESGDIPRSDNFKIAPDAVFIPPGFKMWESGYCPFPVGTRLEVFTRETGVWPVTIKPEAPLLWEHEGHPLDILAFRIISEVSDETHTDDLRTAEGETVTGDEP